MSEELKPTEPTSEPKPQPVKCKEHTKHKKIIAICLAALMVCLLFAVGFGGYNYGYRKGLENSISQNQNSFQGGGMGPQGNFSQDTTDDDDTTDDSTQSTAPNANSNTAPNSGSDTQSGATTKSSQ